MEMNPKMNEKSWKDQDDHNKIKRKCGNKSKNE